MNKQKFLQFLSAEWPSVILLCHCWFTGWLVFVLLATFSFVYAWQVCSFKLDDKVKGRHAGYGRVLSLESSGNLLLTQTQLGRWQISQLVRVNVFWVFFWYILSQLNMKPCRKTVVFRYLLVQAGSRTKVKWLLVMRTQDPEYMDVKCITCAVCSVDSFSSNHMISKPLDFDAYRLLHSFLTDITTGCKYETQHRAYT